MTANAALAFSDSGAKGEPLVLLHGFGGTRRTWDTVVPLLASGLRVIAIDLPGHGQSVPLPERGYARSAAGDVVSLMDRLGIPNAHVCGFSLGGAVASLIAMSYPERVRSLTLVAPGGYGTQIAGAVLQAFAAAETAQDVGAAMSGMIAPDAGLPEDEPRSILDERSLPGAKDRLLQVAAQITRGATQGTLPADMVAKLECPGTAVWGTKDPVLPFAHSANLPATLELRPVEGAGHMLPLEAPRAVAEAISASVSRFCANLEQSEDKGTA